MLGILLEDERWRMGRSELEIRRWGSGISRVKRNG